MPLPDGWSFVQDSANETLTVSHIILITDKPTLDYTVLISLDQTYVVKAYDHIVQRCHLPTHVPVKLRTVQQFKDLLTQVKGLKLCPGNPDDQFIEMAKTKRGKLKNRNGIVNTIVNDNYND